MLQNLWGMTTAFQANFIVKVNILSVLKGISDTWHLPIINHFSLWTHRKKSLKVKVEQDLIILQLITWSPERSSHLPKFTQSLNTPSTSPPTPTPIGHTLWAPSDLALLCLQLFLGKSAGNFHLHSFAQCSHST